MSEEARIIDMESARPAHISDEMTVRIAEEHAVRKEAEAVYLAAKKNAKLAKDALDEAQALVNALLDEAVGPDDGQTTLFPATGESEGDPDE